MKAATKKAGRHVADTYLALIVETPLRVVRTQADYREAAKMIDRLAVRDDLDAGERQYLEAIEVLVEAYDNTVAPKTPDARPPLERLKAVMASSGTTPMQLQKILGGSQSMVSMILNGQRDMSKKAIGKLAEHFKLEPGYFL